MWRFLRPGLRGLISVSHVSPAESFNEKAVANMQYQPKLANKRQKNKSPGKKEGSNEEVLAFDINDLRRSLRVIEENLQHENGPGNKESLALPPRFSEVEVDISRLSSTGDGIGTMESGNHVYVVPFTLPGDKVRAKIVTQFSERNYTLTDFVSLIKPSVQRDDTLIGCKYFKVCGGCQLQMLNYEDQLKHKRAIIQNAYRNFSSLAPEAVPEVQATIGSPKQYGYRTKLTPHFDSPPRAKVKEAKRTSQPVFESVPPIGFMVKGSRKTLDVEDCPIGTDSVREGLKSERKRVTEEIRQYRKGATLLLRESTERTRRRRTIGEPHPKHDEAFSDHMQDSEARSCVTDNNAIATEYVDDFMFKNTAGSFFQNNNSILPIFTEYIRSHIKPPTTSEKKPIKYLIDAYCGSGLFTVTLSSLFTSSIGIDIADTSITAARKNAELNNVMNASFMTADAAALFEKVTFAANETVVVIDPPRKGCDEAFLKQLLVFAPKRVVYVSCNVHTQARDVGFLVEGKGEARYGIESLQGFDFFPQTAHVEGVALLSRSEQEHLDG